MTKAKSGACGTTVWANRDPLAVVLCGNAGEINDCNSKATLMMRSGTHRPDNVVIIFSQQSRPLIRDGLISLCGYAALGGTVVFDASGDGIDIQSAHQKMWHSKRQAVAPAQTGTTSRRGCLDPRSEAATVGRGQWVLGVGPTRLSNPCANIAPLAMNLFGADVRRL